MILFPCYPPWFRVITIKRQQVVRISSYHPLIPNRICNLKVRHWCTSKVMGHFAKHCSICLGDWAVVHRPKHTISLQWRAETWHDWQTPHSSRTLQTVFIFRSWSRHWPMTSYVNLRTVTKCCNFATEKDCYHCKAVFLKKMKLSESNKLPYTHYSHFVWLGFFRAQDLRSGRSRDLSRY